VEAEVERLRAWLQHLRSDACDDGSHFSGSLRLCDIDLCCDLALSGDPAPQLTATDYVTTYQHLLNYRQQLATVTQERDEWHVNATHHYEAEKILEQQLTTAQARIEELEDEVKKLETRVKVLEDHLADIDNF
jgi:septal ring factor EnvC (AmiA/AmiB activator)